MAPKCHGVIIGRRDLLYDPKDHGDLCGLFDLVYDPKGHKVIRGRRDLLYDPKGDGDLYGLFDLVYDPKGPRSLEVAVTYFMTAAAYNSKKRVNDWDTTDMDNILISGNELYSYLQASSTMQQTFILINELPRNL